MALNHVVKKITKEGRSQYSNESRIQLLKETFESAIKKSNNLLEEIERALSHIRVCDVLLHELGDIDDQIVRDFEYHERKNWMVFREYANQLEFNIAAFNILMDRIRDTRVANNVENYSEILNAAGQ